MQKAVCCPHDAPSYRCEERKDDWHGPYLIVAEKAWPWNDTTENKPRHYALDTLVHTGEDDRLRGRPQRILLGFDLSKPDMRGVCQNGRGMGESRVRRGSRLALGKTYRRVLRPVRWRSHLC